MITIGLKCCSKGQALAQRVATSLTAGSGLLVLVLVIIFIVRWPVLRTDAF